MKTSSGINADIKTNIISGNDPGNRKEDEGTFVCFAKTELKARVN